MEIKNKILLMCIHLTLLHLPALAIVKMETQKISVLVVVSPIISSTSTESLGLRGLTEKKTIPAGFLNSGVHYTLCTPGLAPD